MDDNLRPESYKNCWITFKKAWFGRGVQATAYRAGKVVASAGGLSKEEAFNKIKMMVR